MGSPHLSITARGWRPEAGREAEADLVQSGLKLRSRSIEQRARGRSETTGLGRGCGRKCEAWEVAESSSVRNAAGMKAAGPTQLLLEPDGAARPAPPHLVGLVIRFLFPLYSAQASPELKENLPPLGVFPLRTEAVKYFWLYRHRQVSDKTQSFTVAV